MDLAGDDLQAALFLANYFLRPMRAAGRPVNDVIENFARKVALIWEMSADGPRKADTPEQSATALIDTAEVASILNLTTRQVRRLANDMHGRKRGGVWLFPKQSVIDYAEAKSVRARPSHRAAARGSQ